MALWIVLWMLLDPLVSSRALMNHQGDSYSFNFAQYNGDSKKMWQIRSFPSNGILSDPTHTVGVKDKNGQTIGDLSSECPYLVLKGTYLVFGHRHSCGRSNGTSPFGTVWPLCSKQWEPSPLGKRCLVTSTSKPWTSRIPRCRDQPEKMPKAPGVHR